MDLLVILLSFSATGSATIIFPVFKHKHGHHVRPKNSRISVNYLEPRLKPFDPETSAFKSFHHSSSSSEEEGAEYDTPLHTHLKKLEKEHYKRKIQRMQRQNKEEKRDQLADMFENADMVVLSKRDDKLAKEEGKISSLMNKVVQYTADMERNLRRPLQFYFSDEELKDIGRMSQAIQRDWQLRAARNGKKIRRGQTKNTDLHYQSRHGLDLPQANSHYRRLINTIQGNGKLAVIPINVDRGFKSWKPKPKISPETDGVGFKKPFKMVDLKQLLPIVGGLNKKLAPKSRASAIYDFNELVI